MKELTTIAALSTAIILTASKDVAAPEDGGDGVVVAATGFNPTRKWHEPDDGSVWVTCARPSKLQEFATWSLNW